MNRWLDSGDEGMPLLAVETADLRLTFLPGVGGRLISIVADGRERLWHNPAYLDANLRAVRPRADWPPIVDAASWPNLGGSKTWPAPQSRWGGPPDAVLDSGLWQATTTHSAQATTVTMTSPDDAATGLRIIRSFTVPHAGRTFDQRIGLHNHTDATVEWAAWEVVQVPFALGDTIEVDGDRGGPVDLGTFVGRPAVDRGERGWSIAAQPVVGKLGFPEASGAVRLLGGLELEVGVEPGGGYPDGGSRVELWLQHPIAAPLEALDGLHPDAWLAELEVLSPLTRLPPHGELTLQVRWSVL